MGGRAPGWACWEVCRAVPVDGAEGARRKLGLEKASAGAPGEEQLQRRTSGRET